MQCSTASWSSCTSSCPLWWTHAWTLWPQISLPSLTTADASRCVSPRGPPDICHPLQKQTRSHITFIHCRPVILRNEMPSFSTNTRGKPGQNCPDWFVPSPYIDSDLVQWQCPKYKKHRNLDPKLLGSDVGLYSCLRYNTLRTGVDVQFGKILLDKWIKINSRSTTTNQKHQKTTYLSTSVVRAIMT